MDDFARRLGTNIRSLRESLGMSLSQLSARCGVAKSTLSQLEAGATNPTLATLAGVANALAVDLHVLLEPSRDTTRTIVVRAGRGTDVSGQTSTAELLASTRVGPSVLEFHHVVLQPGTHETSPSHGAGSREHVFVTGGELEVGPEQDRATVGAGDYASYPGDKPHQFRALGGRPSDYWIVAAFPQPVTL